MSIKIIDSHMHFSQWVREDGESTFDVLKNYQKNNNISGVDNMCCSNVPGMWDSYEIDQSILGAILKIENPLAFSHGCLYIPKDYTQVKNFRFKDQLEELMELGLDGVKICDFKPDAYKILNVEKLMDEYQEYISACEKYGVHMCWHVADPEANWDINQVSDYAKRKGWFYGTSEYPTFDELIAFTYSLLDAHPRLQVMLAHAFFKSFAPDEVVMILNKYPYLNIDLAPGWEMFKGFRANYEKWYNIFREYSNRFLYATDANMIYPDAHLNDLAQNSMKFFKTDDEFVVQGNRIAKGIKLEKEYLENIMYKNHERIVGEKPREINKTALKKYIERYLPLMPDSKNKQMTQEYYRKNLIS